MCWKKAPLASSAQQQELAPKLHRMSQLIREWDVRGDAMFFPGVCSGREPFNSILLQVVPAYIHLWMHLISFILLHKLNTSCALLWWHIVASPLLYIKVEFTFLSFPGCFLSFSGCFRPSPCVIHCSSLCSFSVKDDLHAEQHRPDFCTIITSDRTLALFRTAAIGYCDCAAVSLMCTSVRVHCFTGLPVFVPGFLLHLDRSVHHSEDTLLELT